MDITVSNESILVIVKFKIRGNLRFLSHAETVSMFQRACVRAGIRVSHSKGFNPHPRMSLPLPRSVGVESDAELMLIGIDAAGAMPCSELLRRELSTQLPTGCEITELVVSESKSSYQPTEFTCIFPVKREYIGQALLERIESLNSAARIEISRRTDAHGNTRNIDVKGFIKSIAVDHETIVVQCNTSPAGTIRADEILGLLDLDIEKLSWPVRKTEVVWSEN